MTIPENTQKLLRLLSQVILADGHILDTEVNALVKGVADLALTDDEGQLLSADVVRDWFAGYLDELNAHDSKEPGDVAITRLILSLADWPEKQAVVDTLESISLSDADFHIEEKLLISIVRSFWQFEGLDAPGATIGE